MIPSKDDIANITNYLQSPNAEPDKIGNAEKFYLELNKVPQLEVRVKANFFKISYDQRKSDIKPDVEILKQASKELRDSPKIPKIVELILEVGNFLNEGTPRGGIFGFQLESLNKLADTKSADNTQSLLMYLAGFFEEKDKSILNFGDEIPHMKEASKVALPQLTGDINNLQKDYDTVCKSIEGLAKDKFTESLSSFLSKCSEDLVQIQKDIKTAEGYYSDLVTYFGENPKEMQPDAFFGIWSRFQDALIAAAEAQKEAKINAEKLRKRDEAKEKRQEDLEKKKTIGTISRNR